LELGPDTPVPGTNH